MDKSELIGPLTKDLPATWACIICGNPPTTGQIFRVVTTGIMPDISVTVQHEYLADCGIPANTLSFLVTFS